MPYYTVDSRASTSLHNGRVIPLMHRPWAAQPYPVLTYNNKRDGHCTLFYPVCLTLFSLTDDVSHLQYNFSYIRLELVVQQ
jgi:hypothetical protein